MFQLVGVLGPSALALSPLGFIQAPRELAFPWAPTVLLGSLAFLSTQFPPGLGELEEVWGPRGWATAGSAGWFVCFDGAPFPPYWP